MFKRFIWFVFVVFQNKSSCIPPFVQSFHRYVRTVALASAKSGSFAGQTCVISGWGLTTTGGGGSLPDRLQYTNIKVGGIDRFGQFI
jgi:hypothetical protein